MRAVRMPKVVKLYGFTASGAKNMVIGRLPKRMADKHVTKVESNNGSKKTMVETKNHINACNRRRREGTKCTQ